MEIPKENVEVHIVRYPEIHPKKGQVDYLRFRSKVGTQPFWEEYLFFDSYEIRNKDNTGWIKITPNEIYE